MSCSKTKADIARPRFFVILLLSMATISVYAQVVTHEFLCLDDTVYVTENRHVTTGLTAGNVRWAFTTTAAEFWHPLTWLSYMLDYELFGFNAGGFLWTNLVLHLINAVILFALLANTTRRPWRSAVVALLFAIHPLHVESVAWVSGRKDLLSTLFALLAIRSYCGYAQTGIKRKWIAALGLYGLSLMAKPMLVTLPFLLLLFDYWPLDRWTGRRPDADRQPPSPARLILEKVPFFCLALAAGLVAIAAQQKGGGIVTLETVPMGARIANALTATIGYLGKTFWPFDLAVFYPFPQRLPAGQVWGALALLLVLSAAAVRSSRARKYAPVGWCWFLITLAPVIGIIKIGDFAMADRYSYVSLIGIFLVVAWGAADATQKTGPSAFWRVGFAGGFLFLLTLLAWHQVRFWRSDIALFEHTLAATRDNYLAHHGLGHALARRGRIDDAVDQFERAVRIEPHKATLRFNLARALFARGDTDGAIEQLQRAVEIAPAFKEAYCELGRVHAARNDLDNAIRHYLQALRLDAGFADATLGIVRAMAKQGGPPGDLRRLAIELQQNPSDPKAQKAFQQALFNYYEYQWTGRTE